MLSDESANHTHVEETRSTMASPSHVQACDLQGQDYSLQSHGPTPSDPGGEKAAPYAYRQVADNT